MPLVSYPTALPVEAVTNMIRVVRASSYIEEKELFAASAWNTVGYLLSVTVGGLPQAGAPPAELVELKSAQAEPQAKPEALPVWVAVLIDLVLKLLRELLPD